MNKRKQSDVPDGPVNNSDENLIFIDLEMTGLNPEVERIIEIAVVVVSPSLDAYVVGPSIAVYQPLSVLDRMDMWNRRTHGISGLLERVEKSVWPEHMAEEEILLFLNQFVPKGVSPMCGNILNRDRRFLAKYMPTLHGYFHHSDLDANCLEIMAKRWGKNLAPFIKKHAHGALPDVLESIEKMRYYRAMLFK